MPNIVKTLLEVVSINNYTDEEVINVRTCIPINSCHQELQPTPLPFPPCPSTLTPLLLHSSLSFYPSPPHYLFPPCPHCSFGPSPLPPHPSTPSIPTASPSLPPHPSPPTLSLFPPLLHPSHLPPISLPRHLNGKHGWSGVSVVHDLKGLGRKPSLTPKEGQYCELAISRRLVDERGRVFV